MFQGIPPLWVRAADAAERGCARGDAPSCHNFIDMAEMLHGRGYKDPEDVKAKVCPQVPQACEE